MPKTLEQMLREVRDKHNLTGISASMYGPHIPKLTVYLHFQDDSCCSASALTFEEAVERALLDHLERSN